MTQYAASLMAQRWGNGQMITEHRVIVFLASSLDAARNHAEAQGKRFYPPCVNGYFNHSFSVVEVPAVTAPMIWLN